MNVNEQSEGRIVIALSRRNLEGLLLQLDEDKPGDAAQIMRTTDAGLVIVVAEEDAHHYNSESREDYAHGEAGASGPGQVYGDPVEG